MRRLSQKYNNFVVFVNYVLVTRMGVRGIGIQIGMGMQII